MFNQSQGANATPVPALTVKQLSEKHPAITEAGYRWLLFNRERNGFTRCVIRVGRRVLIDESEFLAWLRDQREGAA